MESQLTAVRTAISNVLSGVQSITEDGQAIVYPDINSLNMRESMLMKRLDEINAKIDRQNTGRVKVAEF